MIELTEPAVCYRWWVVAPDGALKRPYPARGVSSGTWELGVNVARCQPLFGGTSPCWETVPNPGCGCGLHAYARLPEPTPEALVLDCPNDMGVRILQARTGVVQCTVVGAVLLWGRMLSGGKCVRASHGEILAVSGVHSHLSAARYGVPEVDDTMLRTVALEHGSELSDEVVAELLAECETPHRATAIHLAPSAYRIPTVPTAYRTPCAYIDKPAG